MVMASLSRVVSAVEAVDLSLIPEGTFGVGPTI